MTMLQQMNNRKGATLKPQFGATESHIPQTKL